jgi:tetratricopeptide (TPR) repeat protein
MKSATTLFAAALISLPAFAFAAGSEDSADDTKPPEATETTTTCEEGMVWNEEKKECLKAEDHSFNDDQRFRAVRELAYAGRPEEALIVLAAMTEGDSDRVLTYKGFANRKAGRLEQGLGYYNQALAKNPNNILTRSYMGQMFVELGEMDMARAQLAEIRARGGAGTWAEASLANAVQTGITMSY